MKIQCNERLSTETYEQYVERRQVEATAIKYYLQGQMVWHSKSQGTYRNPVRQPICCLK